MKRILCLLLAVLMLTLALASCRQKDEDGNDNGDGAVTTAPETIVPQYKLVENNEPQISIVYPTQINVGVENALNLLQDAVSEACGKKAQTVMSALYEPSDDKYEIFIGENKHTASKEAAAALSENSYSVSIVGNKIVIVANHPYLYPVAVEKLIAAMKASDGTLSVNLDYADKSESYDKLVVGANYKIVYPAGDENAKAYATDLRTTFWDMNMRIEVIDDSVERKGLEILVGDTNRDFEASSSSYFTYHGARMERDAEGNISLSVNVKKACELFSKYVLALGSTGKGVSIIEPMLGTFEMPGFGVAPEYEGSGTPEVFDSFEKSNSYYIIVHDATLKDYNNYIAKLESEGFTKYHSVSSNGNDFSIYTDGYNILTLSQIEYYDPRTNYDRIYDTPSNGDVAYMSIAVDCIENSALPIRETDTETVTTVQVTTIRGAGFIIRLADGRFIIIDGGTAENMDYIYTMLCSQNVLGGEPVIAAWMLTHGHTDHIGAPTAFVGKYSNKVKIETFVHNLPGYEIYNGKNVVEIYPEKESTNLYNRSHSFYNEVKKWYPDSTIIIAHAGQRFEYGELKIDILFTTENMYKKQMLDTNSSSVIYSLTGPKGRMIFLGDSVDPACAVLNAIYDTELECDIFSVAHHGGNGGNKDMYASFNPTYAVWPSVQQEGFKKPYARNQFDHTTVDLNLFPHTDGTEVVLNETMTKNDLKKYHIDIVV
ncbi:MAG: MBL fold metallo-hydrolase [Clostridia bacterium]|nr:MBL fold metallo-hydrolase [Clostridia bacterium]